MGIQFAPLDNMRIQHYAMLFDRFKVDFPSIEEHDRLPPLSESKEISAAVPAWRLITGVQMPRIWLVSEPTTSGQYILQFQDDRFLMNWRTTKKDGKDYPSHKINLPIFERYLKIFLTFIDEHRLGKFEPEQCELTYVNHIRIPGNTSAITSAAKTFTFLKTPKGLTGIDENFSFSSSSWSDELRGRVYMSLQSALHRESKEQLLDFRLTARGAPADKSRESAISWLDKGHTIVVGSFVSFTSPEMHNMWGVE